MNLNNIIDSKKIKFLPLIIVSIIGILLLRHSKLTVISEYFDTKDEVYQNIQQQSINAIDLSTDSLRNTLLTNNNRFDGLILGGGDNLNLPLKGDFEIIKGNNGRTFILKNKKEQFRLPASSLFPVADTIYQTKKKKSHIYIDYVDSVEIMNGDKNKINEISSIGINAAKKVKIYMLNLKKSFLKINAEKIDIINCSLVQNSEANLDAKQVFLSNDSIGNKYLRITCDTVKFISGDILEGNISINAKSLGKVSILNTKLSKTKIDVTWCKVHIKDVILDSINTITLGDSCTIESFKGNGKLSLIPKYYLYKNQSNRRFLRNNIEYDDEYYAKITLLNVNPENLILPDQGFTFIVSEKQSFSKQIILYKFLLERYKDNPEQFQKYDVAYQNFMDKRSNSWFSNFVRKNWNYFGYEKNMIFQNSIMLMLFFFSFNLLFFPKILYQGYYMREFTIADRFIRRTYPNPWLLEVRNMVNCFFYTFFVFWGLKLDIENLKVSNIWYCSLILLEYVVGIICLGYIANIIISR
ncbi:hypothetical protein CLU96_0592 [Chryseobacterium sp. 52]|uniref:hypothetical protein n=1 Tax=Chryseobacterium sp. 52 TaxID=2035213 RepID=UPI000C199730|nr:hypothetical protein [Chryseobacterium sp. 52]PIF43680.1 hypothetical protein CLU96_0592 [Chryseobacterium sp. 52]